MDILFSLFNFVKSSNELASIIAPAFYTILFALFIFNYKDPHRVWIAGSFFIWWTVDNFVLRVFLPQELITRQIAYSILDGVLVLLLTYRLFICAKIANLLGIHNEKNYFAKILMDIGVTKQEYRLRQVVICSIFINALLCIEHLIRHPEFFSSKWFPIEPNPDLMSITYVYYAYPYLKLFLVFLLVLGLTSMSLDGLALAYKRTKERLNN